MVKKVCSEALCLKPTHGRGLCSTHYAALRRAIARGEEVVIPEWATRTKGGKICSVVDCEVVAQAHGMCGRHLSRLQRHGNPHIVTRAAPGECLNWLIERLTQPFGDECVVWPFSVDSAGYGQLMYNGSNLRASRESIKLAKGEAPPDKPNCLHTCDNPPCINPRHLYWGDQGNNLQDMWDRGRRVTRH